MLLVLFVLIILAWIIPIEFFNWRDCLMKNRFELCNLERFSHLTRLLMDLDRQMVTHPMVMV